MSDPISIEALKSNIASLKVAGLTNSVPATLTEPQRWSSDLVQLLSISILVFCIIVLVIGAHLLKGRDYEPLVLLKLFGISLIVCMSAFLMVAGYSSDQLTPIVGLFGAIAGYLLGKDKS